MAFRRKPKVRPELATAQELVASGSYPEAIDLLSDANRARRDAEIERRLIELRVEAFPHEVATEPVSAWPPEVPDLFPADARPPEIARDELTVEVLRSAIFHHGSLLVRGLIDAATVDRLVGHIDQAFTGYEQFSATAGAETGDWFHPLAGYGADHRDFDRQGVLAAESPPAFFELIDLFDELGVRDLATDFLGDRPVILANKWTLRRARVGGADPNWHQDGAFMGQDIRSLDLWIALSECGVDAPGLDLVGRRIDHVVDTGTDGAAFDWTVGRAMVERVAAGTIVRPVFHPGDAMFFDHLCLHRTGAYPEMTLPRYAVEAWFAARSNYPAEQIPIAY
jgi:hypothetical protein